MNRQDPMSARKVVPFLRSARAYLAWEMSWVMDRVRWWFVEPRGEAEPAEASPAGRDTRGACPLLAEQLGRAPVPPCGGHPAEFQALRALILKQRTHLHSREWIGLEALRSRFGLNPGDEEALLLVASPALLEPARELVGQAHLNRQDAIGLCGTTWRGSMLKLLSLGWLEISEGRSGEQTQSSAGGPRDQVRVLGDVVSALLGVRALDPRLEKTAWLQTLSPSDATLYAADSEDAARRVLLWYHTPEVEQAVARYVASVRGHRHLISVLCDEITDRSTLLETLDLASRSAWFHEASLHLCGLTRMVRASPHFEPIVKRWVDTYIGDVIISGDDIPSLGWEGLHMCEHFGRTPSNPRGTSLAAQKLSAVCAMNADQEQAKA